MKALLYWNHICVLHKQEKEHLMALQSRLKEEGIDLTVRYFGLGYPEHMSDYLARPDAELPDLIVSADLEVFEDPRIFGKFSESLIPLTDRIELRPSLALDAVWRGDMLLPFVAIPLVYYTRTPQALEGKALSDLDLAIGGINNSAGKSITKTLWCREGKAAAREFLQRCEVSDMPIGAFQSVRLGQHHSALVPSIYALRADEKQTFLRVPKEGPLLIPSYLCARNTLPIEVTDRILRGIIDPSLCNFYASGGDLIVYPQHHSPNSKQMSDRYQLPSADWLETLDPVEFYSLYCARLATAIDPVTAGERAGGKASGA
ncbi:MAG: hypothetical protein Q4A52_07630 [Bacillota bacterium]|nr:hypothetical protein [Bacillota bacterium]